MRVNTPPKEVQWLDHCTMVEIFHPQDETSKPWVQFWTWKAIYFKIMSSTPWRQMPTFWIMVFNSDNLATCCLGCSQDSVFVQGFDGERIDDTDVDAFSCQELASLDGFCQSDTSTDDGYFVTVTLLHNLRKWNKWIFTIRDFPDLRGDSRVNTGNVESSLLGNVKLRTIFDSVETVPFA